MFQKRMSHLSGYICWC